MLRYTIHMAMTQVKLRILIGTKKQEEHTDERSDIVNNRSNSISRIRYHFDQAL